MNDSKFSRRRFVQAGAAALTAGVHSSVSAAQPSSALEKLNIAAIGVGNRGVDNIVGVKSENIVALCDVDERFLARMASRRPKADTYRDFRKLLERKDLDAVLVSTPDHTHAVATLMAMRRGLHVYCERPLAHNIHEARLVAKVAGETKMATQMGNQHHASDGYRRAGELMQSGVMGAISEVHCWSNRPLWPQGLELPKDEPPVPGNLDWDLWLGPAPRRSYHRAYHPQYWRAWWDFGTGAIGDFGPHLIDPIYGGLRLTSPTTVKAASSPVNDQTAPQWSIIRFQFPARDALPPVTLTWYDGVKQPSPEITGLKRLPPNGSLLVGERGKLFIPELGRMPVIVPGDKEKLEPPATKLKPSPGHWQEWILACKGGGPAGSEFSYAAALTEVCLLGNVALRAGEKIEWDAKQMKATNLPAANQFLQRENRRGWSLEQ